MTGRALAVQADAMRLPLPDASVAAVVTDPPYNLAFMGRRWDAIGGPQRYQRWCRTWGREALRVLKPGGWMLAFGGTRTWHRLACGIEDAGFEMRDTIADFGPLAWLYGQGFPKGKACLKPGWEPIVVARRPGSSVLQTDACRIAATDKAKFPVGVISGTERIYGNGRGRHGNRPRSDDPAPAGRWPANVVLTHGEDCQPVGTRKVRSGNSNLGVQHGTGQGATYLPVKESGRHYADPDGTETVEAWECEPGCPVALLDQQSGTLQSGLFTGKRNRDKFREVYGAFKGQDEPVATYGDCGGASRFFYTAKADASERVVIDGEGHPTVKPLALMRWLVRLVSPPGGLVLDMFCGSGTTGEAAMLEGLRALVCDLDPTSVAKAVVRTHPYVRRRRITTGLLAEPEQASLL